MFNYHLSRARRVIVNALAARWCLLRRPIIAQPERVYVQALHNYLRTTESRTVMGILLMVHADRMNKQWNAAHYSNWV